MWTHDASVSLPSSSGGLDALLNTPRTTSQLWDHRRPGLVPNTDGVHAEKLDNVRSSPLLVRHAGVDRTPKRVTETSTPHWKTTHTLNTKSSFPSCSPLKTVSPTTRQPTISPVTAPIEVPTAPRPKKARIDAERGRRVDLRDKFTKLRDKLPMGGQKGSKVNILDRAMSYIDELRRVSEVQSAQLRALQADFNEKKQ
ncbi:hypothetical protein QFC20_000066 [Naganishia adeliensis]|uniref:Uncharacterized protein n=1 Tax=Naganishia adeliensis TaxID=92952 RepID=A0ACC2X1L9_9TREE|nr:hypothetical protein QFC20_000066 [Naganishia adeliensis]